LSKSGVYEVSKTIYLKPSVSLYGEGENATFFKLANDANRIVFDFPTQNTVENHYVHLADFAILGNKEHNINSSAYGIHLDGIQRSTIENVLINGTCSHGIYVEDTLDTANPSWQNLVYNCKIYYAGEDGTGDGINLQNYTPDWTFDSNMIGACEQNGISLTSSGSRNIVNNHIWSCGANGIKVNAATRDRIENNEIETNTQNGIMLDDAGGTIILGNVIRQNSQDSAGHFDGILFHTDSTAATERGDNCIISSNRIYDAQATKTQNYAINFSRSGGDILNLTMSNNNFVNNKGGSICNASALANSGSNILNNIGFITQNAGVQVTCSNGTWIAHGLAGDPGTTGSITVSMRGPTAYNATTMLLVPTVLQSNSTHFQIEYLYWNTTDWTTHAVFAAMSQTVWWFATYKP
jgi:parallel beta-helix repeat protein